MELKLMYRFHMTKVDAVALLQVTNIFSSVVTVVYRALGNFPNVVDTGLMEILQEPIKPKAKLIHKFHTIQFDVVELS